MGTLKAERTVEIEAPASRCYEIIADLERTPEWQDSMKSLKVLESDREGRAILVEVTSDAKVKDVTNQLRFSYQPGEGMTWDQEKGDLKWMKGRWTLEDLGGDRTRATYALEGDTGRMLGLLIRGPVEDKLKEWLTKDAAEGLKAEAEAGN